MRSRIYADDSIPNTERKFGSAKNYYVADFVPEDGVPAEPVALLFTDADIQQAMERAAKNPEDIGLARRRAIDFGNEQLRNFKGAAFLALAITAVMLAVGAVMALAG